ncbi:MAG: hypothetical protein WAM30_00510 [Candidatus Dormiibacterota bacterium]
MPGRQAMIIAAMCAILYSLLVVVSVAMSPNAPPVTASADQILAWTRQSHAAIELGGFIDAASNVFLLGFLALLLRRAEPRGGYLSILTVAGLIGAMLVDVIAVAISWGQVLLATSGGDAGSVRALFVVQGGFTGTYNNLYGLPYCLFIGALAALIFRTRVLPVAYAWVAALIAVLAGAGTVVGIFGPTGPVGFATFLLTLAWPLAAGVYLLVRFSRRESTEEAHLTPQTQG